MKLSIIMPVFNEEETIASALESVLYQRVNFDYEVIICDDASTDKTAEIVLEYQKNFPCIKYHKNSTNLGNAKTFFNALKIASGDYFQVLDGDDFFSNWHKLQRQVEFLDNNPDYCAVAHAYLRIDSDNKIDAKRLEFKEDLTHDYYYDDRLFNFYYHTSTFMFKNIFKHKLYKVIAEDFFRGDVIRFQTIQSITNEKIKYLNFFGSVYNINNRGIWSSLSDEEKIALNLNLNKKRAEFLFSGIEREVLSKVVKNYENYDKASISQSKRSISYEKLLQFLYKYSSAVAFSDPVRREFIFQNCNYFSQIDELLESIGRIFLFEKKYNLYKKSFNDGVYAILVYGFTSDSGGIIREINDLIKIFTQAGKKIYIYSTEMAVTKDEVVDKYFNSEAVSFIRVKGNSFEEKIKFLIDELWNLAPEKLFPYISHNDVVGGAVIQKHLAGEIILNWVYDHGTSIAVSNSSITKYIAKNDSYYYTLKSLNKNNKIDIIPPIFNCKYQNLYIPFKNHKSLITASASARSYKFETKYIYQYHKIIAKTLKKTGGKHYHYGPLTDEYKNNIYAELNILGVNNDNFIHIEWEANFSESLIAKEIDLFIASFPVSSARIAVEVNSVGIPILGHESINRLFSIRHFISPDNFYWENEEEFFLIIDDLNIEKLKLVSEKVEKFVKINNSFESCSDMILKGLSKKYEEQNVAKKSFINLNLKNCVAESDEILKEFDLGKIDLSKVSIYSPKKFSFPRRMYYSLFVMLYNFPFVNKILSKKKYNKYLLKLKSATKNDDRK